MQRIKKAKYKASAFIWLGRLGNKDDLTYLIPMSDYWQGDRLNHYRVTMYLWMTLSQDVNWVRSLWF
ncbi:MAG: hypothetical protein IPO31_27310 [Candidatus Obscuribacter sp.]|nr:hypothetical protein [Candidatus Obscuribacter sp.]